MLCIVPTSTTWDTPVEYRVKTYNIMRHYDTSIRYVVITLLLRSNISIFISAPVTLVHNSVVVTSRGVKIIIYYVTAILLWLSSLPWSCWAKNARLVENHRRRGRRRNRFFGFNRTTAVMWRLWPGKTHRARHRFVNARSHFSNESSVVLTVLQQLPWLLLFTTTR